MRNADKIKQNTLVEKGMDELNSYLCGNLRRWNRQELYCNCHLHGNDFRRCNAEVFSTPKYDILMSYTTIVAFIDKDSGIFYDILRLTYGYTATSAQHIAKFAYEYIINESYRWYPV